MTARQNSRAEHQVGDGEPEGEQQFLVIGQSPPNKLGMPQRLQPWRCAKPCDAGL
jgi:hypothetical protein